MTSPGRPRRRAARVMLVILVVTWLAAFTATHMPGKDVPSTGLSDKQLHVIGFFVLGSLVLLNLSSRAMARLPRILVTLAILAVYAALDERTQPLVGRSCELLDWVADVCGAAAAIVLWELLFLAGRKWSWVARLTGH